MSEVIKGDIIAQNLKVGIVISRWNEMLTSKLLEGAETSFSQMGVSGNNIFLVHVPGAWEIPLAAQELASRGVVNGIVCLGAILQGETLHAQQLNTQLSVSLASISLKLSVPITWGILACTTLEQAWERTGGKLGNKGTEAAATLLELISVVNKIRELDKR